MKTYLLLTISACMTMISCTKDSGDVADISGVALSSMATSQDGFVLMRTVNGEGTGEWRIKMNDIAAKAYREGLKNFPVNSMIVKEKIDASGALTGYDVMFRTTVDVNSSNGWLWSSLSGHGEVIYDESQRGATCQNCHEQSRFSSLH